MLAIKNLHVKSGDTKILNGVTLSIKPGKIHALMGPNGSGKSTLASVIMGHPGYRITRGSIMMQGKRINTLPPEERAALGLFLSFQYPVEVPGLALEQFLRTAYNNIHPDAPLSVVDFHIYFQKKLELMKAGRAFAKRSLNEGFSGGEKKKSEILQMAALAPTMAILDETDSGLDVDALKTVARGLSAVASQHRRLSILLITHYCRILRYIKPDKVHIMIDGKIAKTGNKQLATQVEKKGYDWLMKK